MDRQYLKKWITNGYRFTASNYERIWRINAIHYVYTLLTTFVFIVLLLALHNANLFNVDAHIGVVVTCILSLVFIIWSVVNLCITEANLAIARNTPYSIKKSLTICLRNFRWLQSICFYIVYLSSICIGLAFLVVPGLYFIASSYFAYYIFVEENETILNSFKKSHQLTKKVGLHKILGLFLILSFICAIAFTILFTFSNSTLGVLMFIFLLPYGVLPSSIITFTFNAINLFFAITLFIPFSSMINLNSYLSAPKE